MILRDSAGMEDSSFIQPFLNNHLSVGNLDSTTREKDFVFAQSLFLTG